jgi:hypothetical protein
MQEIMKRKRTIRKGRRRRKDNIQEEGKAST